MAKPIIDFSVLRDAVLDQHAENTLVKMTDNTLFAAPVPELSVLETALLDFRAAMVDANLKSRQTVIVKDQKRKVLEDVLRDLALYVAQIAKGDPALILAAGYEHTKSPQPTGPCPKPLRFRVEIDTVGTGRVKVSVKAEKLARFYRFEHRPAGSEGAWTELLSTRSSNVIEGLEPLKAYEFRVVYLGRSPVLTYSDVITQYAL